MTKDPVCGMEVEEKKALTSTYAGKQYAFCGPDCKQAFDLDPKHYATSQQEKVGKTA
jgi:YHS domain-containing protein